MKNIFLLCTFSLLAFSAKATSTDSSTCKWNTSLALGQYTAKLGLPNVAPLRLGLQAGVHRQWNKNAKRQFRQSIYLAEFKHRNLQTAIQLFTEFHYAFHYKKIMFSPLMLGGGYVASIQDLSSIKWNGTQYEKVGTQVKHNFLISLGSQLMYATPWKITHQPVSIFANYRMQVQGIFIQKTVPAIAYSSINLGMYLPWPFKK
jgi:hypothetical protein